MRFSRRVLDPVELPDYFWIAAKRSPNSHAIVYRGRTYPSYTALAYASGLALATVRDRLAKGAALEAL